MRTVGLVAENSPDYIARTFSLWESGAVVVPLRSADDTFRISVADISEIVHPAAGSGWVSLALTQHESDERAQILFTSGTEGEPKGVILTHRNLADTVKRLNAVMNVTNEIREYVGIPVYHSFGFARCRAICAAGGKAFIPARGFNPMEINSMLESGQINAISAVPSLWRVLLQTQSISALAASRVRWIEIGSQSMDASEKKRLRALFPNATIVQHYGLTEASRSTFLEIHKATDEQLQSVGKPFGDVEIDIAADGRIKVRGPHISNCILTNASATDPRDADGWITTNDLGSIRDGFLYFQGRADDVINCGGIKIAPDTLELGIRNSIGNSGDLAVCRVPHPLRGDGILVAATSQVLASDTQIVDSAVAVAASLGVNARDATYVIRVNALARTDNGKVKRQEIARAFSIPVANAATEVQRDESKSLRAQIGALLGVKDIQDKDTFVNLGGDSLRYIQACVVLEKKLGYLPVNWENQPMSQLDHLPHHPSKSSRIEPSVILRAVAILSVVINHSGAFKSLFAIDGAAFMLLLPAGFSFARFQLQRVLESGRAVWALAALPRVIVPAVLLLGIQQLRHRSFEPSALFLYNNYLKLPVLSFWFIEVFVQIHLILALLLLIPAIRQRLKGNAWTTSVIALVFSTMLTRVMPHIWNTDHIWNRVPHHVIWYFFLGWCIFFAKHSWQRWSNTALIIVIGVMQGALQLPPDSRGLWIIAGGLFLNWSPSIQLPTLLVRAISALAAASLYIYTSHMLILEPVSRVLPQTGYWGQVTGAILGGIVFWYCFETAWQWADKLFRRKKASHRTTEVTSSQ